MDTNTIEIYGIDHVQIAMPPGEEAQARAFYGDILGLREVPKPAVLAGRGGVWFEQGTLKLHLGVEHDFQPARKAHPALLVHGLIDLGERCRQAGYSVSSDVALAGYERLHVIDPFGNRIELMERIG